MDGDTYTTQLDVLRMARDKLRFFREALPSREYVGGMEYSALMELIEKTLAKAPPTSGWN